VDDAREGFGRHCFTMFLCLAAKSSHVGVDVVRLAYPLHRPMARSYHLLLQQAVTSFRGYEAPWARIFDGELTVLVPATPNLTWGKSFLPGDAYPLAESS
jgi:hypothetical protein